MNATSVRILADDLKWLRPLAEAEHRTVTNMVHVLLHEARTRREQAAERGATG